MSLAARPAALVKRQDNAPASSVQEPGNRTSAVTGEVSSRLSATDAQRARGLGRVVACERSDALVAGGMSRAEADTLAAREAVESGVLKRASPRSVGHWRALLTAADGDPLEALLDAPRSGRPRKDEWSGAGADTLWTAWKSDYLRLAAPPGTHVHDRLRLDHAEPNDWCLPPVESFLSRTRREFTEFEITLARRGMIAALDLYPHQIRTVDGLEALQIINGDGHKFKLLVRFPTGRIGRPVGWFWQDVRTRYVPSYELGETESADLLRTSLFRLITRWGKPSRVVVDNTLAAAAKWLTGGQRGRKRWKSTKEELQGILALLRIRYRPTQVDRNAAERGVGRARAKPIERIFGVGDLAERIEKHPDLEGAYTGRSTEDRPENHRAEPADWETFVRVVEECVRIHCSRGGRRTEIANGRSLDEIWADEYGRIVAQKLSPAQASILLLAPEPITVNEDGTFALKAGRGAHIPNNRYYHPSLVGRTRQRFVARFNPGDLHGPVHVHTMDGRFVCTAACRHKVGFADTEAARAYERARKQQARAAKRSLEAKGVVVGLRRARRAPAVVPSEPDVRPAAVGLVAGSGLPELPPRASAPASSARPPANKERGPDRTQSALRAGLRVIQEKADGPEPT